jgi:U3 small nucleolar ribonucleoprotein protein IMP4
MAARRTARLRQEYLYRKSLEGKEKEAYERKERLKEALAGARSGVQGV